MRVRRVRGTEERLAQCQNFVKDPEKNKGNWKRDGYSQLVAEFGGGKGDFSIALASKDFDTDHVMIDVVPEILIKAVKKCPVSLENLRFAAFDLKEVDHYFSPEELDGIYLNFSDPWPKKKHYKRRLTYRERLLDYKKILKKGGHLFFKTDSRSLFEFSLCELSFVGFKLVHVNLDVYEDTEISDLEEAGDIIMTEYEKKFVRKGKRIYRLEAVND